MAITRARLEDLTLYHYIKDYVLPLDWVESIVNEPLTYDPTSGSYITNSQMSPSPVSDGRGWVYFDEDTDFLSTCAQVPHVEQSARIVVKSAIGDILPTNAYTVNYVDGSLYNVNTTISGTPATVDYYWHYVSVVDGWPGAEPPPLPIIAIDTVSSSKAGFQLGGGYKTTRECKIHIFATNNAERSDLSELLYNALYERHVVVPDYGVQGEPLSFDGTFNPSYTGETVEYGLGGLLYFDKVKYSKITSRPDWSLLNRFRGTITFNLVSYKERFVSLI